MNAAAAKPNLAVAELKPVGGSGLKGLARKRDGKWHFHATLACSHACPTGATANGVRVRFTFAEGRCGKPPGKRFSVGGAKLGPGGLDFTDAFDPSGDVLVTVRSLRATWDPDNDAKFEPATCGYFYPGLTLEMD